MKNGTTDYVWATVSFPFEAAHTDCEHCPLRHGVRTYCSRTGRYLTPEDLKCIPFDCLLTFHEKENP